MKAPPRALLPVAVIAIATATYALTAARSIGTDHDGYLSIDLAPPSAPPFLARLTVAWIRLFSWTDHAAPAHAAAIAMTALGALSLVATWRATIAWGASHEAAAIVLAPFAWSRTSWIASTEANLVAPLGLAAALVFWGAGAFRRTRDPLPRIAAIVAACATLLLTALPAFGLGPLDGAGASRKLVDLAVSLAHASWLLPLAAVFGALRDRARIPVAPLVGLAVASFFVALLPFGDAPIDRLDAARFHLVPIVALTIAIAPLLDAILDRRVSFAVGATVAGALVAFALSFQAIRARHRGDVEAYAYDALIIAPQDCVIVGRGTTRAGAFAYAQRALHVREDVAYVDASAMDDGAVTLFAVRTLASKKPIALLLEAPAPMIAAFPTYDLGPLVLVMPRAWMPPAPETLEAWNARALEVFHRPTPPSPKGSFAGEFPYDYARPFHALARLVANDPARANAFEAKARAIEGK